MKWLSTGLHRLSWRGMPHGGTCWVCWTGIRSCSAVSVARSKIGCRYMLTCLHYPRLFHRPPPSTPPPPPPPPPPPHHHPHPPTHTHTPPPTPHPTPHTTITTTTTITTYTSLRKPDIHICTGEAKTVNWFVRKQSWFYACAQPMRDVVTQ